MVIEPPRPDEDEKLVALAQATSFFSSDEIQVISEMFRDYVSGEEPDEYFWIVYRDVPGGPPLGFACYGPTSLCDEVYDLYWIAVDPAYQSRKIGTALLLFVEADLQRRNARHLYIETSDTPLYTPTRGFYTRRDYVQIAHLPDYYHVGDGKVIYRKVFR